MSRSSVGFRSSAPVLPGTYNSSKLLTNIIETRFEKIPTLSEWGLIVMAGVLGLAGVLYINRRRAAKASN